MFLIYFTNNKTYTNDISFIYNISIYCIIINVYIHNGIKLKKMSLLWIVFILKSIILKNMILKIK